ncbi:MAG: hypothetical protein KF850_39445 [Labilithrix sp.]|nr:hypothetical protein [Labilithrix sp.]MBX3218148.1 hypothetical protein [Labilithrix sp.]
MAEAAKKDQAPKSESPTLEAKGKRRERRRHRVYVTRNTEYHFRDGFCVAVRDRRSGDFLPGHLAIERRLHGGLKFFPNGAIVPNAGDPRPGEALYFAADGRDLVTSPLERVDRPAKRLVEAYPAPPRPPATSRRKA